MSNFNIVIIGAGLAGVTIANTLSKFANVYVIEKGTEKPITPNPIFLKRKFGESTTYCYGHGGTTNLWHNGLIEIPSNDVQSHFKDILLSLDKYKNEAAARLNFADEFEYEKAESLSEVKNLINNPDINIDNILIPKSTPPIKLNSTVKLYLEVSKISINNINNNAKSIDIEYKNKKINLPLDLLIICCGGINSPKIVMQIMEKNNYTVENIGKNFIDHPMGFLGKIKVKKEFKKLFKVLSHNDKETYSSRTGIVIKHKGKSHIFYFRPAATSKNCLDIYKFKSKLGSSTWSQRIKLILNHKIYHPDILQEIFAQLFNIRLITRNFSFWAVFEQHPQNSFVTTNDSQEDIISWDITNHELQEYTEVIQIFIKKISNYIDIDAIDIDLKQMDKYLWSAAHHSGTCALGTKNSVVDENLKLKYFNNIYVCDGSVIPAHSYANTGLTIAQLALKLCDYIKSEYVKK
ncbi:GMC oxidoreductase [Providencia sp. PROV118]|uniref:GMC oxidoreductase n=1 Tax=Providencia sp. PROV118 TaxID=2949829 RepID=UPI00234954CA|nr:GMC oxidoreductase [Providencia sp. PROV118]